MWDSGDLAYLAGLLDGEGCFSISTVHGKHHKACVSCSNTHKPTIEWLKTTFGGSVSKQARKRKENHRIIYSWQVVASDAEKLCKAVVPYLKQKTEQALLLIALRQTANGKKPTDDVLAHRSWLTNRIKELKHVSWD